MNEKARAAYLQRLESPTELRPLTEKEAELLGNLMNTEPMVRALTIVVYQSQQIPHELRNLDFSDSKHCHKASQAQGQMLGVINAIEAVLQLTELPTESGESEDE